METAQTSSNPHYDQWGHPLVPPAERPFIPVSEQETAQETVWFNATDKDAVLDLYVGTKPVMSPQARIQWLRLPPLQLRELRTGLRRFIIRKGERRSIACEFDQAIQQTHCMEADCTSRPMYCRDATHHKMVTGGLGPQLINERVQFRPVVHPSLLEAYALEQAATLKAREFLAQKETAEKSMMVAYAEAEKAKAIHQASIAHETKPLPTTAAAPSVQTKKDK